MKEETSGRSRVRFRRLSGRCDSALDLGRCFGVDLLSLAGPPRPVLGQNCGGQLQRIFVLPPRDLGGVVVLGWVADVVPTPPMYVRLDEGGTCSCTRALDGFARGGVNGEHVVAVDIDRVHP